MCSGATRPRTANGNVDTLDLLYLPRPHCPYCSSESAYRTGRVLFEPDHDQRFVLWLCLTCVRQFATIVEGQAVTRPLEHPDGQEQAHQQNPTPDR